MLQNTREWRIGRRGEILNTGIWARFGATLLDQSAASTLGAPLLHEAEVSLVAPDHLIMRRAVFFMETKTKEEPFRWGGGPRGAQGLMPRGDAHGIERRSYAAYRQVEARTKRPVVVSVLCISTGELLANSLRWLGEPYPSVHGAFDIVNWPKGKFRLVCEFDRRRLRRYFYDDAGRPREAPARMPPPDKLQQLVAWLRPEQGELEWLREDLISRLEDGW
jgi:hypothetical protein